MFRVTKSTIVMVVAGAVQSAGFLVASAAVAATPVPPGVIPGGVMQVVAHEDDDLLFMNPDVSRSLAAGLPSATVFLTAGELSGDGDSAPERARNRQRGAQNAYAAMAAASDDDDTTQREWDGDAWRAGAGNVERYWLRDQPRVQLLFVNLPDGSLKNVNAGAATETIVPAGGLVTTSSRYSRSEVVVALHALLSAYQPLLLRIQDPEPDQRIRPTTSVFGPSHPDHVNGGLLTREAASSYPGPLYEVSYRDYNTTDSSANLSPADVASKSAIMERYYVFDRAFQRMQIGDRWLDRQYYRWSRGTDWATLDSEGHLQVFVVRNGQLRRYSQPLAGAWSGPTPLASADGPLAPGVAVGREADGRLAVFAHRLSDHHVVVLRQEAPGGQFQAAWADLGRPNPGSGSGALLGTPAVASNGDGRLAVFVRNTRDGVSTLTQTTRNGPWDATAWTSLQGTDIQDGLSAVTTPQGGIELFASTRSKLLRWRQDESGGVLQLDTAFPVVRTASPPRAFLDPAGRVEVAYLQPGTAELKLIYQDSGTWSTPINLGGTGETAQPAMTPAPAGHSGRVLLFARNQASGISVSLQGEQPTPPGGWTDLGGLALDQPAAVTDAAGDPTVVVVGPEGVRAARVTLAGDHPVVSAWATLDGVKNTRS